jgi:hypothetical protein
LFWDVYSVYSLFTSPPPPIGDLPQFKSRLYFFLTQLLLRSLTFSDIESSTPLLTNTEKEKETEGNQNL